MKKVTFSILLLMLIQICNLDVMGAGFEIPHTPQHQASTLEVNMEANESKYDTAYIKTSAVCKMCKERIEHDMSFEKGVKAVELDLKSQVLTIVYKNGKTTKEELKVAVTEIGYDADDLVAVQKSHDRLPACCQKDVDPH